MQSFSNLPEKFYSNLPIFRDFLGVSDEKNFHDVPEDWLVVVSDIKGSTKAIESGRYKDVNILGDSSIIAVLNCVQNIEIPDFQKFDDTLRMTIDSDQEQRKKLVEYLEAQRKAGALFYGIQISDSALMTCMVFDRKDRHLHFVDGASGGYALAAKQMKGQLAGN